MSKTQETGELKKGAKIRVYQKPFTQEESEGEATLVKQLFGRGFTEAGVHYEDWKVRFPNEDGTYHRMVSPRDLIPLEPGQMSREAKQLSDWMIKADEAAYDELKVWVASNYPVTVFTTLLEAMSHDARIIGERELFELAEEYGLFNS